MDIFENIEKTEYTISESGIKVPYSDWDRPQEYYNKIEDRTYTTQEYINMCRLKDRNTALFDKRWKSAQAVIDLVAKEININPQTCGLMLYGVHQKPNGELYTPLAEEMRKWFDKSGDKVKLKKRITELEAQIEMLKNMLKGGG